MQFGDEYDIFTERTEQITSSVLFTYKVDGIAVPKETPAEAAVPKPAEKNKFIAWVKGLFD